MGGIKTDARVDVVGLRELRTSLRKLSGETEYHKQLRQAGLRAGEIVAVEARLRAPVKSGRLRKSIRVKAQQTGAQIAGGGARVPYFGFIDYGGTINPRGHPVRRPFIKTGRIMYPALRAKRDETIAAYTAAVTQIIESAGLDVSTS